MTGTNHYDVIILGGSFAGLSAAMSLGRSLRKVLIIDNGKPCNRNTPFAHNFITHDGSAPGEIAAKAKEQVLQYKTVSFHNAFAEKGKKTENGFEIACADQKVFTAEKLILATGVKDVLPEIEGFAACWAISILHCPYCHGYEVKHQKTGLLMNGPMAFEFSKMIHNLSGDLTIYTNGESTLTTEQTARLESRDIKIDERPIDHIQHQNGQIEAIHFKDQSKEDIKVLYGKSEAVQHNSIAKDLNCDLDEFGLIIIDETQETTAKGVYACGDNSSPFRALPIAIAAGNIAGAIVNKTLVEERF